MKHKIIGLTCVCCLVALAMGHAADVTQILKVSLDNGSFNPGRDEEAQLSYTLTAPDKVTVLVYDADNGLVRTLAEREKYKAGPHKFVWDGRDNDKQVVPNEAYTFVIETASGTVYDPTTFSGAIVSDITDAQFNLGGTVNYRLPEASRVLIRLGIHNGPMLKTLVDWKPRVSGQITEYWQGYDENKLIKMREHKDFTALITYVTLPDATVITYGNDKETYRSYKLGRGKDKPLKTKRPFDPSATMGLRPESLVPPAWVRAPKVRMTFPKVDTDKEGASVPNVEKAVDVRIDVDPSDLDRLRSDQFEVIYFVDNVFSAEAERGYLPLNWRWELLQVPPGEHVLTVNISSFKGQVGVASRKVNVVKPGK